MKKYGLFIFYKSAYHAFHGLQVRDVFLGDHSIYYPRRKRFFLEGSLRQLRHSPKHRFESNADIFRNIGTFGVLFLPERGGQAQKQNQGREHSFGLRKTDKPFFDVFCGGCGKHNREYRAQGHSPRHFFMYIHHSPSSCLGGAFFSVSFQRLHKLFYTLVYSRDLRAAKFLACRYRSHRRRERYNNKFSFGKYNPRMVFSRNNKKYTFIHAFCIYVPDSHRDIYRAYKPKRIRYGYRRTNNMGPCFLRAVQACWEQGAKKYHGAGRIKTF